jgi:hypothetical protein
MSNTVGKISGQMLESNLLREGVDLAFDSDLLYLNTSSKRIGINNSTPFRTLLIDNDLLTNDLIVDNSFTLEDLSFTGNTLSSSSNIYLYASGPSPTITTKRLDTANLYIDGNSIVSKTINSDINLIPAGSGNILFDADVEINGSLHATGDVTFDGNLVIGSDNNDNVSFAAELASDIVPDLNNFYDIGTSSKRFSDIFTYLINGTNYAAGGSTVAGIDLGLRAGNTWYVATNGNNSNVGDHPNGPFATIEWALSQATFGDTILIYPGTYVELFPLVIPAGVTIRGSSIRDVKIVPDTASTHEDVFKLNDQTTVEDLTIADFYYDSGLDKGYAFSFAPNINVVKRSPYIRNISVITKGSVISGTDPLGYDQADAGRGAKIDGASANASSNEATMLFHSATFITPGVDCIVMKNGVRVEWLNCFIYYAYKGLYAENGSLGFAGLGLKYGAEVRSIGSANVYGMFGAWADGNDTLIYLITHNFGYIGSGKSNNNDPTNVIQANEVVELNSGTIYYQSVDHKGNFRIGDLLKIEGSTGKIILDSITNTSTNLNVTDGTNTSYIDAFEVTTGNITINGNTIQSNSGNLNFLTSNTLLDLTSNIVSTKSLILNGTVSLKKNLILGNNSSDTTGFVSQLTKNFLPLDSSYTLGSSSIPFRNLYAANLDFGSILIDTNVITTTVSNSDLELAAHGLGVVRAGDSLMLDQNLVVTGSSQFTNLTANIFTTTSNSPLVITNLIAPEFDNGDIKIQGNVIKTTLSNSNLELRANSSAGIIVDQTLQITNSTISNILNSGSEVDRSINITPYSNQILKLNSTNAVRIPVGNNTTRTLITTGEIRFNNLSSTFQSRISGTTKTLHGLFDADLNTSLTAESSPGANDNIIRMTINGTVQGTINSQAATFQKVRIDEIEIDSNKIRTTNSNSDIQLDTSGTGVVNVKNSIHLSNNILKNAGSNAITSIISTGGGYVRFAGDGAVGIPIGDTSQQPVGVPTGGIRINTDTNTGEVFDGTTFIPMVGNFSGITAAQMDEITNLWILLMG